MSDDIKIELPPKPQAVELPKVELAPKAVETPKVELPKVELAPKAVETPKVELPKVELAPKAVETPKVESPKVELDSKLAAAPRPAATTPRPAAAPAFAKSQIKPTFAVEAEPEAKGVSLPMFLIDLATFAAAVAFAVLTYIDR